MTPEEIAADKALCEAASNPEWEVLETPQGPHSHRRIIRRRHSLDTICNIWGDHSKSKNRANADFIVSARTRWPAYIAEVERLQAENEALRKKIAEIPRG